MFWLTWRQHRMQILVTAGMLAVLGTILLVHGLLTASYISENLPVGCSGTGPRCAEVQDEIGSRYQQLAPALSWLPLLPGAIGIFWGAPLLAREFERRTDKLAWTQSVSRARWIAVKLGVLGLLVALAGLAFGAMVTAWTGVFEGTRYGGLLRDGGFFALAGIVPAAWWLFTFMLGVAAGAAFGRMLPAMAVTLAVFVLVLIGVFTSRDSYAEPLRALANPSGQAMIPAGSRVDGELWLDATGKELAGSGSEVAPDCFMNTPNPDAANACMAARGFRSVTLYQPPDRFWRFQLTEAGLLLAATVALGGIAVERTIRRRT